MASTLAAHQVKITIVEAQNLTRTNDWNEGSDAYCSIQLHGKVQEGTPHKTSTQKQSLSPKWNETFTVELSHSPMNDTIEIFVWGEKMLGKLFIGRVEIPVTLLLHGAMVDGWFKLLPQSVIDISKTVTGHLHLILHYSQVQVPAPVRVPEKTKTSSSSSYPGNSPAVNCPICNRTFTALTINQHLDLCTQQPPAPTTTTTTTVTTTKPRGEVGACPVCCKTFPIGELDRHVESCLASQPIEKPKRSKAVPLPSSESEETAQLQAVLIASKLEAQKEKEKRKNEQKENNTTDPLPTIEATPPPSGFAPVYPPLPYMAYPSSGMPMAPPPFIPSPYMAPFPDQSAQPDSTSQPQLPPMYYPPMYPPFYAQPGQPPMVGVPFVGAPSPYAPTTNPPTTLPPQPPKTDLLF